MNTSKIETAFNELIEELESVKELNTIAESYKSHIDKLNYKLIEYYEFSRDKELKIEEAINQNYNKINLSYQNFIETTKGFDMISNNIKSYEQQLNNQISELKKYSENFHNESVANIISLSKDTLGSEVSNLYNENKSTFEEIRNILHSKLEVELFEENAKAITHLIKELSDSTEKSIDNFKKTNEHHLIEQINQYKEFTDSLAKNNVEEIKTSTKAVFIEETSKLRDESSLLFKELSKDIEAKLDLESFEKNSYTILNSIKELSDNTERKLENISKISKEMEDNIIKMIVEKFNITNILVTDAANANRDQINKNQKKQNTFNIVIVLLNAVILLAFILTRIF